MKVTAASNCISRTAVNHAMNVMSTEILEHMKVAIHRSAFGSNGSVAPARSSRWPATPC